jgi:hypothetical protein
MSGEPTRYRVVVLTSWNRNKFVSDIKYRWLSIFKGEAASRGMLDAAALKP